MENLLDQNHVNSIYIHIPFCNNICSYCDFSKMYYKDSLVNKYLEALEKEIKLNYKNELIKTLYIGGGSPSSLSIKQLEKLFNIIKLFKLDKNCEFSIEVNSEDMTVEKIKILSDNKVNRVSIGVQSFNKKILKLLNRKHSKEDVINLVNNLVKYKIDNINIDLMYAIPNQSLYSIKKDLDLVLNLNIKHISYYSLILEKNTKLYVDKYTNVDEDVELKQYNYIKNRLNNNNFNRYEISNYSKIGYESKHNLVYWNNNNYYGFGLGASGYINNIRYTNTKNINKYIKEEFLVCKENLNKKDIMDNEIMLSLRLIKGINKIIFYNKYKVNIKDIYKIDELIKNKLLVENEEYIYINKKYLYVSNEVIGSILYG